MVKVIAALGITGLLIIFLVVNLVENDVIGLLPGFIFSFIGVILMGAAIILGDNFTVDPDEYWRNHR